MTLAVKTAELLVDRAAQTAERLRPKCQRLKWAVAPLYLPQQHFFWLSEDGDIAAVTGPDRTCLKKVAQYITDSADMPVMFNSGDYPTVGNKWIKVAYSPTLRRIGEFLNFFKGKPYAGMRNFPSPLAAMLTTGLLGGGLGYGIGYLGENLLGWKKNRMRRTGAILGALLGVAPGAVWAATNASRGLPITSPEPFNTEPHTRPYAAPQDRQPVVSPPLDTFPEKSKVPEIYGQPLEELEAKTGLDKIELGQRYKQAAEFFANQFNNTGLDAPPVKKDKLNRVTYGDPVTASLLSPQMKMTTTAATEAASRLPGGVGPGFVTPMQMGRLASGMGAGYVSGAIVGKVLGALTGMPEGTQNLLKRTGMYAGLVNAVVPRLFG